MENGTTRSLHLPYRSRVPVDSLISEQVLTPRSGLEEFVRHPHKLVWVCPDQRVVSTIDNDELRARDAVVEHLCVVDRYPHIVRASNHERRTSDLSQAVSAVERHRLPPRSQHQLLVLVRDEPSEPVGAFLVELLRGL